MTVEEALAHADKWHMPSLDTAAHGVLADEVRRLRIFEARYNVIRAGETPVFCIEDLGRESLDSRCLFDEDLDAALDALMGPNV